MLERIFESSMWNSRLFTIFAVVFSLFGAIILFIIGSLDIWEMVKMMYSVLFEHAHPEHFHEDVVGNIIGAIDLYLIAIVLLIFAFGVYELFISKIEPAEKNSSGVLNIHSLDQLKDKVAKVIVMVLVVNFFQRVLHTHYDGALEMLYFAASIFLLALALYFLHKGDH
ncbi:MAG: YqhA family protein [Campylobacterota bacterium]|nr:YqhA family protein [Campylobacterota bacterium]